MIRQIILIILNEVNPSVQGPGVSSAVLLRKNKTTSSLGQAYILGGITWRDEASNSLPLKQMLLQAGIESDNEAFLISLQSIKYSNLKALRILLNVPSAQSSSGK